MTQAGLPATNQTVAVPVTNVAPGMNPPHGMPGHRCEIAVGAPLNSQAATVNPAPVNTPIKPAPLAAPITINGPQPKVAKTAPGMNPPHGQPGHRCDISVGAPLDSKPITTAPVMETAPVVPVKKDSIQ
jgi:hypothetical protein